MNNAFARGAAALLALAWAGAAQAQTCTRIDSVGAAHAQGFDTLAATGTSAVLPPGWAVRETGTSGNANGQYSAGTGSSNAGDTYSFGTVAGERALGAVRSGTLVPSWGACFSNGTGSAITALDIAYTGEQWRLGASPRTVPDRLDFQYSLDATGLADGSWIDADALDFSAPVTSGTVGARDGNAAAHRSVRAATLGALSIPAGATFWIRWSDADVASADDGLAIDDFRLTARGSGGGRTVLEVLDAAADEGDAGIAPLFFALRLNQPAGPGGVTVDFATRDGSAAAGSDYAATSASATIAEGDTGATVSVDLFGDTTTEADESFFLDITRVTGADLGDGSAIGTLRNDDFVLTPIHDIQGNGAVSPLANRFVTLAGIVTGRKNNGFFVQASDAEADADPLTSEGVFVFTGGTPPAAAAPGNRVRVRGTVFEFVPPSDPHQPPLTEIGGSPTVALLSTGHALPAPVAVGADMTRADGGHGQLEPLEGMRVTVPRLTTVAATEGNATPHNATGTANGIVYAVVSGIARPFREPGLDARDPIPGGAGAQPIPRWDGNPEILTVDSDSLGGPAFLLDLPAGSVIEGLTGPLDYGFRRYTVHRDPLVAIDVVPGPGPRAARAPAADEFTVAAYNLERFYDNLNDAGVDDSVASAAAYQKRLQKASLGIRDYLHAPDVLVAIEVEKQAALEALAARINADAVAAGQPDPQYVAHLLEGNDVGGIDIGVLVKTAPVAGGAPRVEVRSVAQAGKDTLWEQPDGTPALLNDRPPLVLDAVVHYADGRAFPLTVIGVHQRSLIGAEEDTDRGERVRLKRQRQAEFLAAYIQQRQLAAPATRIVVLGDFNAFAFNDGLADTLNVVAGTPTPDAQTVVPGDGADLVEPDLVNLGELAPAAERYSFLFDGNAQTLDHVLVNEELVVTTRSASADHARINADFSDSQRADAGTATRTADHDPVIAYFAPRPVADLGVQVVADSATVAVEGTLAFTATVRNDGPEAADSVGVGFAFDAVLPTMAVAAPAGWTCDGARVDAGRTSVACHAAALARDAQARFAITAVAAPGTEHATVSLAVAAHALSLDPVAANDQAIATADIAARVDLSVALTGPAKKLHTGDVAPFALDLHNAGPYSARGATMTLRGDASAADVSIAAPAGWSCTVAPDGAGRFVATCGAAQLLAVGADPRFAVAIRVPARRDATGHLTLAASAASSSIEIAPADDEASYQNRIVGIGGGN